MKVGLIWYPFLVGLTVGALGLAAMFIMRHNSCDINLISIVGISLYCILMLLFIIEIVLIIVVFKDDAGWRGPDNGDNPPEPPTPFSPLSGDDNWLDSLPEVDFEPDRELVLRFTSPPGLSP